MKSGGKRDRIERSLRLNHSGRAVQGATQENADLALLVGGRRIAVLGNEMRSFGRRWVHFRSDGQDTRI
jgi:hypothetical protein